jgi:inosine-uridine nucleoside N-ribohydrolase
MSSKVVLVSDAGIDGAFAVALALNDPQLEVLGLLATAGNVSAEQATKNMQILIDQLDPPRWPRLGEALAVEYPLHGVPLHGPHGLGGVDFPCAPLHHVVASDKMLAELVRQAPKEVTVICLGPLTVVARAMDLCPELPGLVKRLVIVGGSHHEPGNAGPVSEFHFACDPKAARQVLRSEAPITLIPLDQMRRVLFAPTDLLGMPADGSPALRFLRQIVPYGIAANANLYGIEGFYLKDVLGVVAVARPEALHLRHVYVDVEVQGELTRGMSVFDQRPWKNVTPNIEFAHDTNTQLVRKYITEVLGF